MKKYVFSFKEGTQKMKDILGGKGANLCEMLNLDLPVPLGFIVSTEACNEFYESNQELSKYIQKEIFEQLVNLEKKTNKKFGSGDNPLLLSIRSGSRVSMPGMMDTILNLGMNDQLVKMMAENDGERWFAYDSYRRFIGMYAGVVNGFSKEDFDGQLTNYKKERKIIKDQDLSIDDLKNIIDIYKSNYQKKANKPFPQDPSFQLIEAIKAIFKSWMNERAISYRKINKIPDYYGTAVIVQEMVYGNNGEKSGSGVAFSRNPATGENEFYGEFLINAQGEDVVAGVRTPLPIDQLKNTMANIYVELYTYVKKLERHYRDMQDVEFTIENQKLYMLQTRTGKRTMQAALKIAIDLVNESLISKEEAISRLNASQFNQLLHPRFEEESLKKAKFLTKGLATSPGAAYGKIYFTSDDIIKAKRNGYSAILVRLETSPEDIEGMNYATGILTVYGGMTSHAAVVARGMGITCVSGCSGVVIENKQMKINNIIIEEGDYISIDGNTGNVYLGEVKTTTDKLSDDLVKMLGWADQYQKITVFANADTKEDAELALKFKAKGIGLCRTEHMFFKEERIIQIRKMILAKDDVKREEALREIEKFQEKDFYEILKIMNNKPVTIRYLDPPLHEFMPKNDSEIINLGHELKMELAEIKKQIGILTEVNPMMGHRGCRLAVTYPSLIKTQTRAVMNAAKKLEEEGYNPIIELMIPLVAINQELVYLINLIKEEVLPQINYKLGTMIEVPRAALIADKIANHVDFFSFGTNDLTQMTYGFSRDDATKFLDDYYQKDLISFDPFMVIDEVGVGKLIEVAVKNGRLAKPGLKIGICGEHGGDPLSIQFFFEQGLDYVSCSPYRVPIAILASAQLTIKNNEKNVERMSIKE